MLYQLKENQSSIQVDRKFANILYSSELKADIFKEPSNLIIPKIEVNKSTFLNHFSKLLFKSKNMIQNIIIPQDSDLCCLIRGVYRTVLIEQKLFEANLVELKFDLDDTSSLIKLEEWERSYSFKASKGEIILCASGKTYIRELMKVNKDMAKEEFKLYKKNIMITGGFGSVAKFLVEKNTNLVNTITLLVRRLPTESETMWLTQFKNVNLLIKKDEITEEQKEIINSMDYIFHASGVLKDELILLAKEDNINNVLSSKIDLFDQIYSILTNKKTIIINFSSVASIFGNPSQMAYSAANNYLDQKARDFSQVKSLQIAPLLEAGMAATMTEEQKNKLEQYGLKFISNESFYQGLLALINSEEKELLVASIEINNYRKLYQTPPRMFNLM